MRIVKPMDRSVATTESRIAVLDEALGRVGASPFSPADSAIGDMRLSQALAFARSLPPSLRLMAFSSLPIAYNGRLSCFFAGISTFLSFSIASARAIRFRVECGMMTSSM
jgi:hypothetical protein